MFRNKKDILKNKKRLIKIFFKIIFFDAIQFTVCHIANF